MTGLTRSTTTIANQVIFDYTLPPAVLLTFVRLQALCPASTYPRLGPLDFNAELLPLLGLKKTQAREHLRLLRMAKLITWSGDTAGCIWITLPGQQFSSTDQPAGDAVDRGDRLSEAMIARPATSSQADYSLPSTMGVGLQTGAAPDLGPGSILDPQASDPSSSILTNTAGKAAQKPGAYPGEIPNGGNSASNLAASPVYNQVANPTASPASNPGVNQRSFGSGEPDETMSGSPVCDVVVYTDSVDRENLQHQLTATEKPERDAPPTDPNRQTDAPSAGSQFKPPIPAGSPTAGGIGASYGGHRPDPWADELEDLLTNTAFSQSMNWLAKAGVWTDRAIQVARQISSNEKRGHAYLPTRADILGWMAYCFAYKTENQIQKPAQVLVGNLLSNRRCPEELRPVRICARCSFAEGFCRCNGDAEYAYPEAYPNYAFDPRFDDDGESFWGVCLTCHGYLCSCREYDSPETESEDVEEDEADE